MLTLLAPCQPALMVRAMLVLLHLVAVGMLGCTDNPYVIGRLLDGGNEAACQANALFCSGFEAEALRDEWTTTTVIADGALERTSARVHSGEASLRAETRGADSAAVVVASLPVQRAGSLYLRAYVYISSAWATETMNLFFIGDDPSEPFVGIDLNILQGAVQVFSPQMDPVRTTGSVQIARDRWVCLGAELVISDAAGALRVRLDDQLAVEVNGVDTLPPGGVHLFRAGVDWSSGQTSFFEVFLDDIAISNEPIDCL